MLSQKNNLRKRSTVEVHDWGVIRMSGFTLRAHRRGLAVVGIVPVLPALLVLQEGRAPGELLQSGHLLTYALVLAAAVFSYLQWRTASASPTQTGATRLGAWLTVGLTLIAVQGLVLAVLVEPTSTARTNAWPLLDQLTLLLGIAVATLVAHRIDVPRDPAAAGALGGFGLAVFLCVAAGIAPSLRLTPTVTDALNVLVMLAGLLVAWIVLQRHHVALWTRHRLAMAATLMATAGFIGNAAPDNRLAVAVSVVLNLQGGLILCLTCQRLLRRSVNVYQRELRTLQATLAEARAEQLHGRELLHEVSATVAGITNASHVMKQGTEISSDRRERLEDMLAAELARLTRLMRAETPSSSRTFDVDAVVRHLVASHRERGLDVRWSPTGLLAVGDPDDLAEVVNILLENARRHGGRQVDLEVTENGGHVDVTCADNGPGVSDDIRPRLFVSGVRGADSPGQGLGLAIAQRLMSDRGGSLELADSVHTGARFVARLPKSELVHGAQHVA